MGCGMLSGEREGEEALERGTDTAASGNYGPLTAGQAGILLQYEPPIEVTCANELNMRSVSTILLPILA